MHQKLYFIISRGFAHTYIYLYTDAHTHTKLVAAVKCLRVNDLIIILEKKIMLKQKRWLRGKVVCTDNKKKVARKKMSCDRSLMLHH